MADKGAKHVANLPRVYEIGEPSARPPKKGECMDKDELDFLLTPIAKEESPQMLELRRIALIDQSANLINAKKATQEAG